jgi:hypothetical protein
MCKECSIRPSYDQRQNRGEKCMINGTAKKELTFVGTFVLKTGRRENFARYSNIYVI